MSFNVSVLPSGRSFSANADEPMLAAAIRQGKAWKGTVIATLEPPLPSDNFEGLAVAPQADGSAVVWVISDDNQISFQRTILLKLRWKPVPEGKRRAREKGAR